MADFVADLQLYILLFFPYELAAIAVFVAAYFAVSFAFRKKAFSVAVRIAITVSVVLTTLYVVIIASYYFSPPDYRKCDMYTEAMNGGVHAFKGQQYNIVLCGINGRIDPDNWPHDKVRLQVFSMDGELLAVRYYAPLLGMRFGMQLDYGDNYLTYETEDQGPTKKIAIPPTRWDWWQARLPRLWPW